MRKLYFNKESIELDSGFFFGRGVFETILIKEKPILLKEHVKRLNNGIKALSIGEFIDEEFIRNAIKLNNIKDCVLKIVVTEKNIVLTIRELQYNENHYSSGFKLVVSKVVRNSTSPLTYIKSINYMDNLLENEKAKKIGYNEVIFLNEKGFVTEGSTSNIFMVENGVIYTPNVECGLLNGIIREFIINNYDVIEEELTLDRLLKSNEVFITNSLLGIMKVTSINNQEFKEYKKTEQIRIEYQRYIEELGGA